ncbi:MAG TPA: creatininase family protein [Acidimicrobiales bacterium]|jgi:creatinine amidohydrolase|nr:creatininase family protein [Acidimicrobiales bacterium]
MPPAPPRRRLAELRAPEVAERLAPSSVLIQPIAAIEQHGPHLPLATDLLVAESTVDAVVAERGEELDLWVLPSLAYGKSNEHAWAPGTIWLSATTLLGVLDDLGRSLATLPTKRLAFVNGHGGNTQLLAVANRELRLAHGLLTFLLHPSVPPDSGGGPPAGVTEDTELGMGIHAGRDETSLILHLRPDLVDMAAAVRCVPEALAANRHVRFGGDVGFGWLSKDLHPSGVIGDPTTATAERGKALFESMVANLGEALAEVRTFGFPA